VLEAGCTRKDLTKLYIGAGPRATGTVLFRGRAISKMCRRGGGILLIEKIGGRIITTKNKRRVKQERAAEGGGYLPPLLQKIKPFP